MTITVANDQIYACPCSATVGNSKQLCPECGRHSQPWPPRDDAVADRAIRILTAEEWLALPADTDEERVTIGSAAQPIVRTRSKNLVEGPEKSFKTSFMLRLMLGSSCGTTVFSPLPVIRPRKTLYVHGELARPEIKERTRSAATGLRRPLDNFYQVRDFQVHLIDPKGQARLRECVMQVRPDDLVLDLWQSFITGYDENEYRDVSRACRFIDRLIEDYALTVHISTHTGKDRTRGTWGHSYLAGWRDTLTRLDRTGDGVRVTVDPRWAAPLDPFTLIFDQGTLVDTGCQISQFTKQADAIRGLVKGNGGRLSRNAVGSALGLSGDTLRQALKRAADSGAIKLEDEDVTL